MLTAQLYQVPRLRLSGAVPLLPLCNFLASRGKHYLWFNLLRHLTSETWDSLSMLLWVSVFELGISRSVTARAKLGFAAPVSVQ